jgi:hypothetical protein
VILSRFKAVGLTGFSEDVTFSRKRDLFRRYGGMPRAGKYVEHNDAIGSGAVDLVVRTIHDGNAPDQHTLTMSTRKRFGVGARAARTAVTDWLKRNAEHER